MLACVTAITDAMLVYLDPHFNFVWVNEAYARTCRMAPDEMIGKNHFVLYPHAENEAIFRRVRDTGNPVFYKDKPFEFPDQKDRGITYWDWSLAPDKDADGRVAGLVFTLRETTDAVGARQAARESEQLLATFIDSVPAGIAMFDKEMRYLSVSRRFLSDFRIEEEKLIGRSHYDVFPEIPDRWKEIHRRCLKGEVIRCDEDRFVRADGQVDWSHWEIRPWFTGSGEIGGIVLFSEDITESKETEAALVAARQKAEEANQSKSRFLAAASHDLRQPLAALTLYADALRARVLHVDRPLADNMKECLGTLSELLNDLLDLSKLDAGVVTPNFTNLSIEDLLKDVERAYEPEARIKGLRLSIVRSHASVRSDAVLLRRILGNFVANAIRYTEEGRIVVGCRRRADRLSIEVWDTGIGIPEAQLKVIFEEFKQLDESRQRGSGLGLAIAAKTAKLIDAPIRVRSAPSRGSVFSVEVPLSVVAPAEKSQKMPMGLMLRVALIEDNDHVRRAMATALSAHGYSVVSGGTLPELEAALNGRAPDVLIADYRLPGSANGISIIERMRERHGSTLPAVLITGDTDPYLLRTIAERGVMVLHKPVAVEVLRSCIMSLSERRAT